MEFIVSNFGDANADGTQARFRLVSLVVVGSKTSLSVPSQLRRRLA